MDKAHYYVLIHQSNNGEGGHVLGFYKTIEEAENAKNSFDIPLNEIKLIETDSTLKKI